MFEWTCTIVGPDGTVYAGLKYTLTMKFPDEYPCVSHADVATTNHSDMLTMHVHICCAIAIELTSWTNTISFQVQRAVGQVCDTVLSPQR